MADKLQNRGPRDPGRVNVREASELRYWCSRFAVGPTQLKDAVIMVGTFALDVEQFLYRPAGAVDLLRSSGANLTAHAVTRKAE